MAMTDPIADMLTRIRNANKALHPTVAIPASQKKVHILEIMEQEGYIAGFKIKGDGAKKEIIVTLKYKGSRRVIQGIKRISKPGLRVYVEGDNVPYVHNGLGTAILTTSNGLMTDRKARQEKIGGEVIAYIW